MTRYDALHLHVEIGGEAVFAGRAQFHRSRGALTSTTFQYEQTYLAHPHAYAVDPALELVSGTQHTPGLPGAFSDSAPDRWGRNLIMKRERVLARQESRTSSNLDDVDFLVGVSDVTRQGALRFSDDTSSEFLDPAHTVPRIVSLPQLLHAADAASRDTAGEDFDAVKALLDAGTASLGGARPKAAVLADDGRQLIAKFPHHNDSWDVMAWEATALNIAASAGVLVPNHRLERIGDQHVLLLDRFDRAAPRRNAAPDNAVRVGYMSAMTLLGYRDGDAGDYIDIAEQLNEVGARAKEDARQLFRRVAVSVGLNNTDDHLRNHGFLRGRGGWVLSPAFDINPNPDSGMRQTTIAGADTPADETDGLMELATFCRLSPAEARAELSHVADSISQWREVAARNEIPLSQRDRFQDSFAAGVETLRGA